MAYPAQVLRSQLKIPTQPEVVPTADSTENLAQSPGFIGILNDILRSGMQRLLAQHNELEMDI